MENKLDLNQSISIVLQAINVAQAKGAYTLQDAAIIAPAYAVLQAQLPTPELETKAE
jgi:hypothetical protein